MAREPVWRAAVLAGLGGATGLNSVRSLAGASRRRFVAASASALRTIVKNSVVSAICIINLLLVIVVSLQFVHLLIVILIFMIMNQ
jgi:hypothetical protein